jgi:hypothetical protein
MQRLITLFLFGLLVNVGTDSAGTDPWTDNDLVQPEQVANLTKDLRPPLLIHVGFPVFIAPPISPAACTRDRVQKKKESPI